MKTKFIALAIGLLLLSLSNAYAQENVNIPYYAENFPGSGDLPYRAERCKLDVFAPGNLTEGEKLPVVVWFHGGGLSAGSRQPIKDFNDHRIIMVSVDYRLFPKAKEPDFIEDAAAAVAWTFNNIEKFAGDKTKIYVAGHSAGGYLSMMVGMAPKYLAAHGIKNTDLAGIYPISGQATTHFAIVAARMAAKGRTKPENFSRDNPIVVDEYAPLNYTGEKLPPVHLLCGDPKVEWPARVEENNLMAAMIRTVGGHNTVEFISFPDKDHGSCVTPAVEYVWKSILARETARQ